MRDDCFALPEKIGYCGMPLQEKLSNKIEILKYEILGFMFT